MGDELQASSREQHVKGYVLAGGRSSRMGRDKAMLPFRGRPMLEIALETLREICAEVAISGNREDLAAWAPVVKELRLDAGPAAGIEAALADADQAWVLMLPVDLPRMSATLLRRWMSAVLYDGSPLASYMECAGEHHPALCLAHRDCLPRVREALDGGDYKLRRIFAGLGERLLVIDASALLPGAERFFVNVNTPDDLAAVEAAEEIAG